MSTPTFADNDYYFDGDYPDDEDDECDDLEMALQECGQSPHVTGCNMAGTEYCDFECPFRDAMYRRMDVASFRKTLPVKSKRKGRRQ